MTDRHAEPAVRAPRQPVFNIPAAVVAVLALILGVHAIREAIPPGWDDALFVHLAFVPGRLTYAFAPDRVVAAVLRTAGGGADGLLQAQADRFYLGTGTPQPWTTVSYGLLHGSWGHVLLNGVWLLAFGTPVARRFGPWRFAAFLVAGAWAGAMVHWATHPLDLMPVVGASAAVSGCMGASLRFMFQPHVPVSAVIGSEEGGGSEPAGLPARPLAAVLTDRRALGFLVAWFATNLLVGVGSLSFGGVDGPVAWEAHIGGFLLGLLLFSAFDRRRSGPARDGRAPPEHPGRDPAVPPDRDPPGAVS